MERTSGDKNSRNNQTRTLFENLCVDGTFRRCNLNPMSMCAKGRVSSRSVGEANIAKESCFD